MSSSTPVLVDDDTTPLRTLLAHIPALLQGFAAFDNTALPSAIDDVLARLGSIVEVDRQRPSR